MRKREGVNFGLTRQDVELRGGCLLNFKPTGRILEGGGNVMTAVERSGLEGAMNGKSSAEMKEFEVVFIKPSLSSITATKDFSDEQKNIRIEHQSKSTFHEILP